MRDVTMWTWDTFVVMEDEESYSATGVWVYPNFLSVLGVSPLFGRSFTMDDTDPGRRAEGILISHGLWRERYGADPGVIGTSIRVDGQPHAIIGVMPPDVAAPHPDVEMWVAAEWNRGQWYTRYSRRYNVYGRLQPGVTIEAAAADLNRVHDNLAAEPQFTEVYADWDVRLEPMGEYVVGEFRATLIIAFASVGLVLLIACVNIANMLLARSAVREREIAIRAALGAGRGRITRQLLTESVVLGIAGGAVGIGFAQLTHGIILSFQPDILPRAEELTLAWPALAFALGVSVVTGLLFGFAPAFHSLKVDLRESLSQGGARGVTAGHREGRLRAVLITSQLALTMILLTGAGLLVRTMIELRHVDPGFDPDRVIAARQYLDGSRYDTEEKVRTYFQEMARTVAGLPGVEAVGASSALPMDPMGINYDLPYRLQGQEDLATEELPEADYRIVAPGYFDAMGIPLRAGRVFTELDLPDAPFVAVVNESMARQVWPDSDPIGQRFNTPSTDWTWFEVVGVVGDTRYYGLDTEPGPEMYVAHAQVPSTNMTIVARTAGDPAALTDVIRREAVSYDRGQPSHSILPVSDLIADAVAAERFYTVVLGIFAVVALVLSAAGVYGVLSYWVNQRVHEIGVRMALGADRKTVVRYVVGHGLMLTGVGIGIGLAGALASTRVLANTVYGIGTTDPVTFGTVMVVLAGIALVACWVPAFRASRVSPMTALRE